MKGPPILMVPSADRRRRRRSMLRRTQAAAECGRRLLFLTKALRDKLLKNGKAQQEAKARGDWIDFPPVVKLFTPDASATWLLTELYPTDPDIAFGLCDLGMGFPELGDVSISEIESVRGRFGLPVERDRSFTTEKTITEYTKDVHAAGRIVT
jgi:hypothetical protein